MVDAVLGTKRTCPSCASRFYDLDKDPISCPHCAETFVVDSILPSKSDGPAVSPLPKPEEAPVAEVKAAPADLDDDDKDDDVDEEIASIADVDLGDDNDEASADDSDKFLETDDDDGSPVADIVVPGKGGSDET